MPQFECPKCGKPVTIREGVEHYYCNHCGYKITVSYKIEKIKGNPIDYLLKRAQEGLTKCKKHPKYKGIFKARVKCETCLRIYEEKHLEGTTGDIEKPKRRKKSIEEEHPYES